MTDAVAADMVPVKGSSGEEREESSNLTYQEVVFSEDGPDPEIANRVSCRDISNQSGGRSALQSAYSEGCVTEIGDVAVRLPVSTG